MWQQLLALVAKVLGPLPRHASSGQGEVCLPTATTATYVEIPSWMAGKYCEFTAVDADVDVAFLNAGGTVAAATDSGVASEVITTDATTGRRIVAGTTRTWIVPLPEQATRIGYDAPLGSGKLYIGVSSQKVV